jgi:hypothetical protein
MNEHPVKPLEIAVVDKPAVRRNQWALQLPSRVILWMRFSFGFGCCLEAL